MQLAARASFIDGVQRRSCAPSTAHRRADIEYSPKWAIWHMLIDLGGALLSKWQSEVLQGWFDGNLWNRRDVSTV